MVWGPHFESIFFSALSYFNFLSKWKLIFYTFMALGREGARRCCINGTKWDLQGKTQVILVGFCITLKVTDVIGKGVRDILHIWQRENVEERYWMRYRPLLLLSQGSWFQNKTYLFKLESVGVPNKKNTVVRSKH